MASQNPKRPRSWPARMALLTLCAVGAGACSEPRSSETLPYEGGSTAAGGMGTGLATGGVGGAGMGATGSGDGGYGGSGGGGRGGGAVGGAGADSGCVGPGARFITDVVSASYGPGQDFGQAQMPDIVFGPPRGGGCCTGSLDVVSLGNGGEIVVTFESNAIVDEPGPDFVVFENAFYVGGDPNSVFAEPATVAVSEDGQSWVAFPCSAVAAPFGSCAGWHPVYLDGDDGPIDPQTSGGDLFDLADVGVTQARYVRITDRADITGTSGVFDLDAVGIIHPLCP